MKKSKRILVRPIEREEVDLRRLARAVIELAMTEEQPRSWVDEASAEADQDNSLDEGDGRRAA